MTVSYTASDYLFPFYLFLFVLVCGLAVFLVLTRAVRRWKKPAIGLFALAMLIVGYVLLARAVIPALEHSGCLLTEGQDYTHTTAGTVTAVTPADHPALFPADGALRGGVYLTIDGAEYYVIDHPGLGAGMSLAFTYCPEGNLILSWREISRQEVSALQQPFVPPEAQPEEPVPEFQRKLGTVLSSVGFCCFAAIVVLESMFRHRVDAWLLAQDAKQRREVVPNPWGLWFTVLTLGAFSMIVVGHILRDRFYQALVILIPSVAGMLGVTLYRQHTRVQLQGQTLVVRRGRRTSRYPLSEIQSVRLETINRWETGLNRRPLSRCLVIRFHSGGELTLHQEDHLGLGDLHRRLTRNDL